MGVDDRGTRLDGLTNHLVQRSELLLECDAVRRDAAHVEEIVDEPHHLTELHVHHMPRACHRGRVVLGGLQQLQAVSQRCEWISQLVSQRREKLVLAPIHGVQRVAAVLEHFVELGKGRRVRAGFALAVPKCDLRVTPVVHVAQDRGDEGPRAVLPTRGRDFEVAQRTVLAPHEDLHRTAGRRTRADGPPDFEPGGFAFE